MFTCFRLRFTVTHQEFVGFRIGLLTPFFWGRRRRTHNNNLFAARLAEPEVVQVHSQMIALLVSWPSKPLEERSSTTTLKTKWEQYRSKKKRQRETLNCSLAPAPYDFILSKPRDADENKHRKLLKIEFFMSQFNYDGKTFETRSFEASKQAEKLAVSCWILDRFVQCS